MFRTHTRTHSGHTILHHDTVNSLQQVHQWEYKPTSSWRDTTLLQEWVEYSIKHAHLKCNKIMAWVRLTVIAWLAVHRNSQQDANSYKKFEQTHLGIQKDNDCLLVLVVLDECCNSFRDLLLWLLLVNLCMTQLLLHETMHSLLPKQKIFHP